MLRKLVAMLLTGVLAIFSIGCQKQDAQQGPPPLPKIPKGFESKPGFGGMGSTKPAAEPPKVDAPTTEGAAPADSGAAAGSGETQKTN